MKNLICLLFLLSACNNVERLNTSEISQKMGQYKIKKIAPEEIQVQLREQGAAWQERLASNIASICANNFQVPDSLTEGNEIDIKLVNLDTLSLNNIISAKERQLFEAYAFQLKGNKEVGINTQLLETDIYLYTFPFKGTDACPGKRTWIWRAAWEKDALIRTML